MMVPDLLGKVTNVTRMVCVLSSLPSFPAEFGLTEPMEKKKGNCLWQV